MINRTRLRSYSDYFTVDEVKSSLMIYSSVYDTALQTVVPESVDAFELDTGIFIVEGSGTAHYQTRNGPFMTSRDILSTTGFSSVTSITYLGENENRDFGIHTVESSNYHFLLLEDVPRKGEIHWNFNSQDLHLKNKNSFQVTGNVGFNPSDLPAQFKEAILAKIGVEINKRGGAMDSSVNYEDVYMSKIRPFTVKV